MEKILLIEDDPEVSQFIQLSLEQKGYLVMATSNGLSALKWLEGLEKPHLIICDIGLTDINGLELWSGANR